MLTLDIVFFMFFVYTITSIIVVIFIIVESMKLIITIVMCRVFGRRRERISYQQFILQMLKLKKSNKSISSKKIDSINENNINIKNVCEVGRLILGDCFSSDKRCINTVTIIHSIIIKAEHLQVSIEKPYNFT